jgi:hypothetical protein
VTVLNEKVDPQVSVIKNGVQVTKRGLLLNIILFAALFTFFFVFSLHVLPKVIGSSNADLHLTQSIFSVTIVTTLSVLSFLKLKPIKTSTIFGSSAITSVLTLLLLFVSGKIIILLLVLLIGVFFSVSQLSFLAHFWKTTLSEERGRIGGIIGFATLPFYFIMSYVIAVNLDLSGTVILAAALSIVPIVAKIFRNQRLLTVTKKETTYPEKRTIILFSIPWFLFCLINTTVAANITTNLLQLIPSSLIGFIIILQAAAAFIGTLIGGILADFFGRRLALAISVTLYGIGMALSGLIQNATLAFFSFFAEGLSWGILLTLYIFVIWGDLSNKENHTRLYAIGLVAFYIATAIEPFSNLISQIPLAPSAFLGCTIIFLSNVPIALAPELQSSDFLERIRLKMHIKAAKKAAKKYENQG